MKYRISIPCVAVLVGLATLSACTAGKPELTTDLNSGLEVASALENAYAARANADPKIVADLARLTAAAQAAIASWEASSSSSNEALANAAMSALVAYEASAHVTA